MANNNLNYKKVRTVWNADEEKYYISVVDIVEILTESANPRHYWNVLKGILKEEENETVTNCNQLKLISEDGKYRLTRVVDLTNLFTKTWSNYSVKEYKSYKGLTKENLRDNMTNMELVLNMLEEV